MKEYAKAQTVGLPQLKEVIDKLPRVLADKVYMQSLRAGANIVRDAAKAAAPVAKEYNQRHAFLKKSKKGDRTLLIKLRDEIRISVVTKTEISFELAVHIGRAFWGMFFEFGTSKMGSHPWFRPSWDRSAQPALDAISKDLGTNLEKQAERLAGPLNRTGLLRRF